MQGLFWFLVLGCGFGSVSASRLGHTRTLAENADDATTPLTGLVQKYDITRLSNGTMYSDDFVRFHPVVDGEVSEHNCEIDLPERMMVHLDELLPSHRFITIPGGILLQDIDCMVQIPDAEAIEIIEPPTSESRRRLAATSGTLSALIIRVSTSDAAPGASAAQLRDYLFNKDVCLKTQMDRCSWGNLRISQQGSGVIDVRTDRSLRDYMRGGRDYQNAIVNDAESIASRQSAHNNADLVLYVLPRSGDWVAYASIGGRRSVYNDHFFNYVATQMHEVGHNLLLYHANEGGEYQDYTGYMSQLTGAHLQINFPRQCYNAQNHWQLGWYPSNRVITMDPTKPSLARLAGFAHYDRTRSGQHYVLIKAGNVYVQYNSAVGINRDTTEYPNEVIAVADQGRGGTELVAHLRSRESWQYNVDTDQGRRRFILEVCSSYASSNPQDSRPNQVIVSVGYDESLCSQAGSLNQNSGLFELGSEPEPQCKPNYQSCSSNEECCSEYCMPYHNICDRGWQAVINRDNLRNDFRSHYTRDTYISRFFNRRLRGRE